MNGKCRIIPVKTIRAQTWRDNGFIFLPFCAPFSCADPSPTRGIPSFPPPVLSVEPSSGVVKHGEKLSFTCTVPTHPQSQSNKPAAFLLLRTAERTGTTSVTQQPRASQVSDFQLQPGVFTVGPLRGGEEGKYTCLYQMTKASGLVNSTVSNVVQITITGEDILGCLLQTFII